MRQGLHKCIIIISYSFFTSVGFAGQLGIPATLNFNDTVFDSAFKVLNSKVEELRLDQEYRDNLELLYRCYNNRNYRSFRDYCSKLRKLEIVRSGADLCLNDDWPLMGLLPEIDAIQNSIECFDNEIDVIQNSIECFDNDVNKTLLNQASLVADQLKGLIMPHKSEESNRLMNEIARLLGLYDIGVSDDDDINTLKRMVWLAEEYLRTRSC